METTAKKPSLFALAQKAPEKKTAAKDKNVVTVTDPGFTEKINQLIQARARYKDLEAEIGMLEGEIKATAKEQFLRLYREHKMRPESFKIKGSDPASGEMFVIVQDKYGKVDENKKTVLDNYEGIVETQHVYTFNDEMLAKYESEISAAIMDMPIPDEDKPKLLTVTESHFVKKGTIEKLTQYEDLEEVFSLIQPIVQLK